jgi:hypothetical protein
MYELLLVVGRKVNTFMPPGLHIIIVIVVVVIIIITTTTIIIVIMVVVVVMIYLMPGVTDV